MSFGTDRPKTVYPIATDEDPGACCLACGKLSRWGILLPRGAGFGNARFLCQNCSRLPRCPFFVFERKPYGVALAAPAEAPRTTTDWKLEHAEFAADSVGVVWRCEVVAADFTP